MKKNKQVKFSTVTIKIYKDNTADVIYPRNLTKKKILKYIQDISFWLTLNEIPK